MKIVLSLLTAGVLFVVGISFLKVHKDTLEINLAGHKFLIPKENSRDTLVPHWLKILPGLDDPSGSTLITFHAQEIQKAIPTYKVNQEKYVTDIYAILSVLSKQEVDYSQYSKRFNDLWYATDSYSDRIIELDKEYHLFKVYREVEYPYSWALLKVKPEKEKPIPSTVDEFWLGHCRLTEGTPLTTDGRLITCNSQVMWDDYYVEFNFLLQNVEHLEKIKQYIKSKVQQWEKG